MIDSHAHLWFDRFDEDRDEVLRRAREAGVRHAVVVGIDVASSNAARDLAAHHADLSPTAGIHPCDVVKASEGDWERIVAMIEGGDFVAVGETGLDLHWDPSTLDVQSASFHRHLDLAIARDLPVVVHCRDAWDEMLALLEGRSENPGGIMHCFSGGPEEMERSVALGFDLGIGGPLTYPRSRELREACAAAPTDRLHLETDCPFLPPQPWRGRRNEPAYMSAVAELLAEILGLETAEVVRLTAANSRRLFRLPSP